MITKLLAIRNSKWLGAVLHIAGWTLFLTLPYLLRSSNIGSPRPPRHFPPPDKSVPMYTDHFNHIQYEPLMFNLLLIPLFYLNMAYLVPKFLLKKKYWQFLGVQLVSLLILNFLITFLHNLFAPGIPPMRMGVPIFIYLLVMLFAVCYCLMKYNAENEKKQKEQENERLKSELIFLRWQISPHFMFNVLNSLVALSRVKSDKLEPMLLRLSTLMRYMVYDNDERKVTIASELEYLESYIDLQSIRLGKEVSIVSKFNVNSGSGVLIEPMLLIPFVENAFKHGAGTIDNPFIQLNLDVSSDKLLFRVKNRHASNEGDLEEQSHGIGLANVRRRLELIYGSNFTLDINEADGCFEVVLDINLR